MIINNVELPDIDFLDADVMEKYETALDDLKNLSNSEAKSAGEQIREQCHAVFDVFNRLWGEGTDKLVFGERTNIGICLNAFKELVKESQRQSTLLKDIASELIPTNRETRRTQTKKK